MCTEPSAREGARGRRRLRIAGLLAAPPALLAWAWVAGSLRHFERWSATAGLGAVLAWALLSAAAVRRLGPLRGAALLSLLGAAWVVVFLSWQRPRTDRDWEPGQERTPRLTREAEGAGLVLEGLRASRHRRDGRAEPRWEKRRLALSDVRTVDFVVEPLPGLPGLAHALLSFGLADGRRLAISVEARRERGESYAPIAGMFRRYELVYVVGDELDLLGLRLDARGHELLIHPLRASPEQAAALFDSMLRRAEALGLKPEFYDSLVNNCSTNLVRHLEELRGDELPFAWQVHLPRHADELAWQLGLIDGAGSLAEARRLARVVGPSPAGLDGRAFSLWLRSGRRALPASQRP